MSSIVLPHAVDAVELAATTRRLAVKQFTTQLRTLDAHSVLEYASALHLEGTCCVAFELESQKRQRERFFRWLVCKEEPWCLALCQQAISSSGTIDVDRMNLIVKACEWLDDNPPPWTESGAG